MVFIGDGETDIPCMRLVKAQGGHSIAVFNPKKRTSKPKANQLLDERRASLVAAADYNLDSTIDRAVKAMVDIVAANAKLSKAGR
jgi:hypothetical protein